LSDVKRSFLCFASFPTEVRISRPCWSLSRGFPRILLPAAAWLDISVPLRLNCVKSAGTADRIAPLICRGEGSLVCQKSTLVTKNIPFWGHKKIKLRAVCAAVWLGKGHRAP
jgi:hypothetical protein